MNSGTDLTLFWLAWQKTCSIRLCCAGHDREYQEKCSSNAKLIEKIHEVQSLASDVIDSMNNRFGLLMKVKNAEAGMRISDYCSEAEGWSPQGGGSAFELLESHLYSKQFLKGKSFKSYLFEDVAGRPGGMNRNLFGYLQRILYTMIAESYGENVYQPLQDEDGKNIEPAQVSLDGSKAIESAYTPDECVEVCEVEAAFREYVDRVSADWDSDHWIVLFCMLNLIPVGSAKIRDRNLFQKGHQTINVWYSLMRSELLAWLREGFSDKAIGMSLNGKLQDVLTEKVSEMSWYGEMAKILAENRKSTGK